MLVNTKQSDLLDKSPVGCGVRFLTVTKTTRVWEGWFSIRLHMPQLRSCVQPTPWEFTGNLGKSETQGQHFHGRWCLEMLPWVSKVLGGKNAEESQGLRKSRWTQTKRDYFDHLIRGAHIPARVCFVDLNDYWNLIYTLSWFSPVHLFAASWTVACQNPQSLRFSSLGYWSGLPFPSPGYLPNSGIEPVSSTFQADTLTSEPPEKPNKFCIYSQSFCLL